MKKLFFYITLCIIIASCNRKGYIIPVKGTLQTSITNLTLPDLEDLSKIKTDKPHQFAYMPNNREPRAVVDKNTGNLWVTANVMRGTGVHVEQLSLIQSNAHSPHLIAALNPYQVQQIFCQHLGYAIHDQQITLFIDQQPVATVANTVTNMGGFDTEALWIGEQIGYDLSGQKPLVCVTPGVKFVSAPVFFYDDMPTFTAEVTIIHDGLDISDIKMK